MRPHCGPSLGAACRLVCVAAWPAFAAAAGGPMGPALTDPTRPPDLVRVAPSPTGSLANVKAAPVWPVLQSVQVSAAAAPSALIDGRIVRVGDRIGGMTLIAIDPQGVLLRGPLFAQRLALLPGITRTASSRDADVLSSARPLAGERSE